MRFSHKEALKAIFFPAGLLFFLAVAALETGRVPISAAAVAFCYWGVFVAGLLLAWRFQSSRILIALAALYLAHGTIHSFSSGRTLAPGPGRVAFEAVALLLPLGFIFLAFARERGFALATFRSWAAALGLAAVFVAVICRLEENNAPAFLHLALLDQGRFRWTRIPQPSWLVFGAAFAAHLSRFALSRKPVDAGLLWSLAAGLMSLEAGGVGSIARAYIATGGLILISSIIENSYLLAYQDELTRLPSRRAFNDATLRLEEPYTIAIVDIDHFKNVNDTYGHEIGDQILRMVASRLARVTGGGQAFRTGGEEFSILFRGKTTAASAEHLELLRLSVESSGFRLRATAGSGVPPQEGERRQAPPRKRMRQKPAPIRMGIELRVTISIGAAESPAHGAEVHHAIRAADKALYRAKQSGRNRVEMANLQRARAPKTGKRRIA